jgi:23S rRNA pseudouridine2605 synthase
VSDKNTNTRKHGLARVLSKLGVCSRTRAADMIRAGRVRVNGRVERDPERPTLAHTERIEVDGAAIEGSPRVYLALNKPRGLIVSASDEHGRDTIYELFRGAELPWIAPVGRLDKASEGLLLLSNDPEWAAGITDPEHHVAKTYHVQVQGLPTDATLEAMKTVSKTAASTWPRHPRGSCVPAKRTRGSRSSWTKDAIAISDVCSMHSTIPC